MFRAEGLGFRVSGSGSELQSGLEAWKISKLVGNQVAREKIGKQVLSSRAFCKQTYLESAVVRRNVKAYNFDFQRF